MNDSFYKQQPGNSRKCVECGKTHNTIVEERKCVECGKTHDTIVEDMRTGDRIQEIDKCKDCLFKNCFVEWGGTARCMTSDDRNVNIAEELNRLERELKDAMD